MRAPALASAPSSVSTTPGRLPLVGVTPRLIRPGAAWRRSLEKLDVRLDQKIHSGVHLASFFRPLGNADVSGDDGLGFKGRYVSARGCIRLHFIFKFQVTFFSRHPVRM